MSEPKLAVSWKRGDEMTDADGSRWIVTKVGHDGPRVSVARVRADSLAARVLFPEKAKP